MKTVLIVVQEFADYKKGARIEDPVTVQKLRASPNASHVVVTQVPDESRFSATTH